LLPPSSTLFPYTTLFRSALAAIPQRYHDMPYRVLFGLVAARLDATRRDEPNGYATATELERDLGMVIASLRIHRGEHAGLFAVRSEEHTSELQSRENLVC